MTIGGGLFFLVVVASVLGLVLQVYSRQRDRHIEQTLQRVDAFLTAWAEAGEWNPTLTARLKAIISRDQS